MKSYSEQMEEQLEPRPERKAILLVGVHGSALAVVQHLIARSEFFPEPTAHEVWVRDRIPRGAHYDPADDGPETDADYMAWVAQIILGVTEATMLQSLDDLWLNPRPCVFGVDLAVDFLNHSRE